MEIPLNQKIVLYNKTRIININFIDELIIYIFIKIYILIQLNTLYILENEVLNEKFE